MKTSEFREMALAEVKARLQELQEESLNLRFQHVTAQLSSPVRIRQVRREIARARTVLREHELGMRTLGAGEE